MPLYSRNEYILTVDFLHLQATGSPLQLEHQYSSDFLTFVAFFFPFCFYLLSECIVSMSPRHGCICIVNIVHVAVTVGPPQLWAPALLWLLSHFMFYVFIFVCFSSRNVLYQCFPVINVYLLSLWCMCWSLGDHFMWFLEGLAGVFFVHFSVQLLEIGSTGGQDNALLYMSMYLLLDADAGKSLTFIPPLNAQYFIYSFRPIDLWLPIIPFLLHWGTRKTYPLSAHAIVVHVCNFVRPMPFPPRQKALKKASFD